MRRCLTLAVVLLGLLLPTVASAAGANPDDDCDQHNKLTRHYTAAELRHGLQTMSVAESQYTSCQQILTQALDADLGKGGGGSSGGGGGSGTIIIIVIAAVILGGGGGAAYWAYRRNQDGSGSDGDGDGGPGSDADGEAPTQRLS